MIDQLTKDIPSVSIYPVRTAYTKETERAWKLAVKDWLKQIKDFANAYGLSVEELKVMIEQINKEIDDINNMSLVLNGLANYQGDWSATHNDSLGYNQADSVTYNSINYISKIDNNTDTPPLNWQRITIDNTIAETTRSFAINEEFDIAFSIPRDNPEIVVKKEVVDTGLTNTTMDVDGSNYTFKDYSLDTTLTPSAVSGIISLTLGEGNFTTEHIGMIIEGNGGKAVLTGIDGSASVTIDFIDTSTILSGAWSLQALESGDNGIEINKSGVLGDGLEKQAISLSSGFNTSGLFCPLNDGGIARFSKATDLLYICSKDGTVNYTSVYTVNLFGEFLFQNADGNIVLIEFTSNTVYKTIYDLQANIVSARSIIATSVYTTSSSLRDIYYDKLNDNLFIYLESYNSSYSYADRLHGFNASTFSTLWSAVTIPATSQYRNTEPKIVSIGTTAYVTYWKAFSSSSYDPASLLLVSVDIAGTSNTYTVLASQSYYNSGNAACAVYNNKILRVATDSDLTDSIYYHVINTNGTLDTNRTVIKEYNGGFTWNNFNKDIIKDENSGYYYLIFKTGYMIFDKETDSLVQDETLFQSVSVTSVNDKAKVINGGDIALLVNDAAYDYSLLLFATGETQYVPINKYLVSIADSTVDTNYFTDFNFITVTETLNNQTANYFFSFDEKITWCIFVGGIIRNIVRDNNGTWEYNSDTTYENETWTISTENEMYAALEESMSITTNHMSGSDITSLTDEQYPEPQLKLNFGMALYTDNADEIPTSDGLTNINYDANARWEKVADTDYTFSMLDNQNVRFKALVANNYKIRVI